MLVTPPTPPKVRDEEGIPVSIFLFLVASFKPPQLDQYALPVSKSFTCTPLI